LRNDDDKIIIKLIQEITKIELEQIHFEKIEKYQGISEYDFYLIKLKGITKEGEMKNILLKSIKPGKIKESLFCICDLAYEKNLNNKAKKIKKISITEERESLKNINIVSVKLFEEDLNIVKSSIKIYFIEMSVIIKNKILKERMGKVEINPKDIMIIGVENVT
jgi:hypothetical protein